MKILIGQMLLLSDVKKSIINSNINDNSFLSHFSFIYTFYILSLSFEINLHMQMM